MYVVFILLPQNGHFQTFWTIFPPIHLLFDLVPIHLGLKLNAVSISGTTCSNFPEKMGMSSQEHVPEELERVKVCKLLRRQATFIVCSAEVWQFLAQFVHGRHVWREDLTRGLTGW